MDVEKIKTILPHRYPFLMIDRCVSIKRGARFPASRVDSKAIGIKNVTCNEPIFQGHFPHRSILPGVLIIEAMAQLSALALHKEDDPLKETLIVKVDNAKFRQPVVPGDTLYLYSTVVKDKGKIIEFDCQARVCDQLVAEAKILAKIYDSDVR